MPKVSVLMNCYNGQTFLKEAIDSVYAQSFKDWEIIFVDNCSADASPDIARQYDNRLKYYRTPENMPLCQARVFARPYIAGDYLCILDVDDLWMETKLEKQVRLMENYSNVGICYTNTLYFNGKDETAAYVRCMPEGNLFESLLSNYFFSCETVMIRRSLMERHNLYFDAKYNVSSDAELLIKIAYYTQCAYIDEPLAKWRYGHGNESDRSLSLFPREYEILLGDLAQMIPNFEQTYKKSIHILRTKINNMYGICEWHKGKAKRAREFFLKALKADKKYVIPFLLSYCMTYSQYKTLRKLHKKL